MRAIIPFNHDWLYLPQQVGDDTPDSAFEPVTLPHSNVTLPHHGFDDAEFKLVSTYRKQFMLPEPLNGRRLYLDFDGAMIAATVTLNGQTFPEHKGGFVPFSLDITDYVREDGDNRLTVTLDSTERRDIPPYGHVVDYLLFGGMYREVNLRYVNAVHIAHVHIMTPDALTDTPKLQVRLTVNNTSDADCELEFFAELFVEMRAIGEFTDLSVHMFEAPTTYTVPANSQGDIVVTHDYPLKPHLWSPDDPTRYLAIVGIKSVAETPFHRDSLAVMFGFREVEFRDEGFYLNGERLHLRGLNRHQTYPYIGAAAPARLQRKDADIIKDELGCNLVRTSHYPQSPHFLDRCDEIGLLVFEEIPGWQHVGDADWQAVALNDVRAMIERDCNHPSIIIWGVRINESLDHHDFYTRSNQLARELDPTRPTGGVRYFQDSEFLEDVFTFNDFSNSVEEPAQTPHLITEFGGHMFPTKSWDNDRRRVDHALLHARVQDRSIGMGGVAGAIGWCAFDYNTHKMFGAGDRICYHGVMDIFRLPKYAAALYASQQTPGQRVVLQVASGWSLGDHNEGIITSLSVFSNCDEIEVWVGAVSLGRYQPDRAHFPYLPHPPFTIPHINEKIVMLAQPYDDLRVVGYLNGVAVAEQRIDADGQPARLTLSADDDTLNADGIDMTRLVFRIADQFDNPLPYATRVVTFTVAGEADLIGENPFPLVGGQAAVFLKARMMPGGVTVTATTSRLDPVSVTVTVV